MTPDTFVARLCALVPPPRAHTVGYYGVLSAHHALRCALVPCADEPEPKPKQLSLFIPRGQLELPAITTLLQAQLRDAAPSRLPWMKLIARVFRVDISVCSRCCGPMRITRAFTTPEDIAAELRGARPPPRAAPLRQLLLLSASPASLRTRARLGVPRSCMGRALDPCRGVFCPETAAPSTPQSPLLPTFISLERKERYQFLRWGTESFENFRAVPPGTGIVHQVNLEYLAKGVWRRNVGGRWQAYPDTLVGTDSHTTMINALSVLGWGVGGIEAEAAMLGQPVTMLVPQVVGFKLMGTLAEGATATDLVLRVVELLRAKGVVGKFVEFFGPGLDNLTLPDRATIANMAPEYGATCGFFPIDDETLRFLTFTNPLRRRGQARRGLRQGAGPLPHQGRAGPVFTDTVELDLSTVVPSIAGPKRPQDRIALTAAKSSWNALVKKQAAGSEGATAKVTNGEGESFELSHGSVVIAAITSCTNTSNPSVMVAAGLLARKAAALGLQSKPWVKTSLAPGSRVVTDYLEKSGLLTDLQHLGFHVVGYGCTTCIGNSGPLDESIAAGITEQNLIATSVLLGDRNFEGRISPHVRANYLAWPPLVVAYALAGHMSIDLYNEPIDKGKDGNDVFLKDIWPSPAEVAEVMRDTWGREMFAEQYASVFEGDDSWKKLPTPEGEAYAWEPDSTYVRNPPYFEGMGPEPEALKDVTSARVLAKLGDSVTTDHISPAGAIPKDGPAGKYLQENGVAPKDFNSFGSRRGNHEVMIRGTFGNIRLRNQLAPGTEGRSNLVGMGVLPLVFKEGEGVEELGLAGTEEFTLTGIAEGLEPGKALKVVAKAEDGSDKTFEVIARLDTPNEVEYFRHGGILQFVLRGMLKSSTPVKSTG